MYVYFLFFHCLFLRSGSFFFFFFFASVSCQKHVRHSLAHQAPLLMMTIFLFSVNCRSVLFCVLTVFNAGPSQCVTREVGITITDNRWPWNAVYENTESIEFKMLQSNLTSAVSLFNYSTLINFRASDRVLRRNMQQFLDIARIACGFNWAAMGRFFFLRGSFTHSG